MNIQPSIVARLKPELVPYEVERHTGWDGKQFFTRRKPMEYRDQILDLQPDEDAQPWQTADLGSVIAEVTTRRTDQCSDFQHTQIRVQFHHKSEVEK